MNLIYPLTAIVSESAGKTLDKLNFAHNKIGARQVMWLVFGGMFVSTMVYILLAGRPLPQFSPEALGLLGLIVTFSFISNVFESGSLKLIDLSLREPMHNFLPILSALIAYIAFPAERKPGYLVAFIAGAVIVYWGSNRRPLNGLQRTGLIYLALSTLFESTLPSIYKLTLHHISPEYISFCRIAAIFILASIFFSIKPTAFARINVAYGLISGVVYAIGGIASLYAIKNLGVVLTMILLLLGPALRYLASSVILREKVRRGEVVSSLLLAVVVLVTVFL